MRRWGRALTVKLNRFLGLGLPGDLLATRRAVRSDSLTIGYRDVADRPSLFATPAAGPFLPVHPVGGFSMPPARAATRTRFLTCS